MSAKIIIEGAVAEELLGEFLAHVRRFDMTYPGKCHFKIGIETDQTCESVSAMLDGLNMPHRMTWKKH